MANTITNISNYSTFGDLITTVYSSATAWDYLGFKDWDKPTGQFSISTSGLGFIANTQARFNYRVWVTGTGGYLEVDNNAEVKKTLTLSNTTILCLDVKGSANVRELEITNTNLSLVTSGNSIFKKDITVYETASIDYVAANTVTITGPTFGNNVYLTSNIITDFVTANSGISSTGEIYSSENIITLKNVHASNVNANNIFCNTDIYTSNVYSSNVVTANVVTANVVNTRIFFANTSNINILYANSINVSNTTFGNSIFLISNLTSNFVTSNSGISSIGEIYSANDIITIKGARSSNVNANTIFCNTDIYTSNVYASSNITTNTFFSNVANINILYANTVGSLNYSGIPTIANVYTRRLHSQEGYFTGSLFAHGGMQVTGDISYISTSLLLSSDIPLWNSGATTAELVINRTADNLNTTPVFYSNTTNAVLGWYETTKRWRVIDVENSPAYNNPLYTDILLAKDIATDLTSSSNTLVTSSRSANTLNNNLIAANTWLQANTGAGIIAANTWLRANTGAGIIAANTWSQANTGAGIIAANTWLQSYINANVSVINSVNAAQNTNITNLESWLSSNNSLQTGINATQNTNITNLQSWLTSNNSLQSGINATQNTSITTINSDIAAIEIVNSNQNTSITTINSDIAAIEIVNSNQNTNITNLQSWLTSNNSLQSGINATQNTNITNLQSWLTSNNSLQSGINATQNTSITTINSDIAAIEIVNSNQNTSITALQGVNTVQNTSITTLQGINTSQNTSISAAYDRSNNAGFMTTTTAISKTLVNRERCYVTGNNLTITLPASPQPSSNVDDWVVIVTVGNFPITTIARNGVLIEGLAENLTIDVANSTVTLTYVSASLGWKI